MPMIPAFCDSCGTPFSSGIFVENCRNLNLSGNKSGPCPRCGGLGSVPDGIFNVIGSAIEILVASPRTISQLQSYADALRSARDLRLSQDDARNAVVGAVPELTSIASLFPRTRSELYAFLTFLLAVLGLILQHVSDKGMSKEQIDMMIERSIENMLLQQENEKIKAENEALREGRNGRSRNSLCQCGSGRRYKHCCGHYI